MIIFYIQEAFNSFRKAKVASFASIITISVAVFMLAGSVILIFISDRISNHIKSRIEVDIFLSDSLDESGTFNLLYKLEKEPEISGIQYTSKDDARKKMEKKLGKGFLSKVLDINPLPASINVRFSPKYVSSNVINKLIDKYKNDEGVTDVYFNDSFTLKILTYIEPSNYLIYLLAGLFVFIGIILVYITAKIIINNRMYQYETMKLVGAKISTIKIPLILNGIMTGVLAGVITAVLYYSLFYMFQKFYGKISFFYFLPFFYAGLCLLELCLDLWVVCFPQEKLEMK